MVDIIMTEIKSVDFVFAGVQQSFADMAADKAVDAEDENAFFAAGGAQFLGICVPDHAGDDPAFCCELSAGLENGAFKLSRFDLDRAFAAGDHQRI